VRDGAAHESIDEELDLLGRVLATVAFAPDDLEGVHVAHFRAQNCQKLRVYNPPRPSESGPGALSGPFSCKRESKEDGSYAPSGPGCGGRCADACGRLWQQLQR